MIHPVVQRFEAQAELLDVQESRASLDDAVNRQLRLAKLARPPSEVACKASVRIHRIVCGAFPFSCSRSCQL